MNSTIRRALRAPVPLALASALAAAAGNAAAEGEKRKDMELPTVEVVGTTPLPVLGTPLEQVPANVQTATDKDIQRERPLGVGDLMERNFESVSVGSAQGNPYQIDLSFRGFLATPLVGAPQGLSVFVDGVRVNEAFGDTVNWDLIPTNAISAVSLVPGSDPVFGLNTLGGSVAVRTKSGREYPGGALTVYGGSYGRYAGEFEYGAVKDDVDFFVAGTYFSENGWRDFSPGIVRQLFAKVGYETARTDVDFALTYANNSLQGTQASPTSLLALSRTQPYTYPDITGNELLMGNLTGSHFLDDVNQVAGNLYFRRLRTKNYSSNTEDNFDTGQPLGVCLDPPACTELNFPAGNDTSKLDTDGYGGSLQYSYLGKVFGRANQLTIGASYDYGRTDFSQAFQFATFTADRGTVGATPFLLETDVETSTRYYGLYFHDVFSVTPEVHLTLAGRYNSAKVEISDLTGLDPALNGSHNFNRFNPAAGVNWNPSPAIQTYLAYNEGMRVPTAVELTCADPAAPCRLPNAFLADPPLEPVIAKTWEGGFRGRLLGGSLGYRFTLFRTELDNDIQFISTTATPGAGFFQNVGQTRRQGLELGLGYQWEKLNVTVGYSLIDATYQSTFNVPSPFNSSAVDVDGDGVPDQITVTPGDKIPGIPRNQFKLGASYAFTPKFSASLTLQAFSGQYARGDENNQDVHGQVSGYAVLNLNASYQVSDGLQAWAKVNNLFDSKYENFGVLGTNLFTGPGFTYGGPPGNPEQFLAPGAPFGVWVGLTYSFDRPKGGNGKAADRD